MPNPRTAADRHELAKAIVFSWDDTLDSRDIIVMVLIKDIARGLETYARQQVAAFRERAAQVADTLAAEPFESVGGKMVEPDEHDQGRITGMKIAAAIRALKDAPPQAS